MFWNHVVWVINFNKKQANCLCQLFFTMNLKWINSQHYAERLWELQDSTSLDLLNGFYLLLTMCKDSEKINLYQFVSTMSVNHSLKWYSNFPVWESKIKTCCFCIWCKEASFENGFFSKFVFFPPISRNIHSYDNGGSESNT